MSSLASSANYNLAYKLETTFGEVPVGTPKSLRNTGSDLKYDVTSESSKEINATSQVRDRIHVGADASGSVNLELSYQEYDELIAGVLRSTYNTFGTAGVKALTMTIAKTAGTITDDGVDGFAGLVAGQWILLTTTLNTGVYRISTRTDDVLTIDASTPLVVDEAGVAGTVSSTRISNGVLALPTFAIEKQFTDVAQYFMHLGQAPSKLDLDFTSGSIVTGSIGFIGKNAVRAAATAFAASPSASNAFGMMNAVTGVGVTAGAGAIIVRDSGGSSIVANTFLTSLKFSVDNKTRGQKALGVLGNAAVAPGTFEISGTIEAYLADGGLYDAALSNETVSITFPAVDADLNGYAITLAHVKLDVSDPAIGGMDTDVMVTIPFTAIAPDTSVDRMLTIDRFGVAIV